MPRFPSSSLIIAVAAGVVMLVLSPARARAQSAAGEWDGSLETPGASVPLHFTLKRSGDTLSGTVRRTTGDVPLTGRARGDSVMFTYTIMYNGEPFVMNLRGRVKGDSLTGVVDFGGGNEGPWVTKRVRPSNDAFASCQAIESLIRDDR